MLIAANTGLSAWIDRTGRIVQKGPRRAPGVIIARVSDDSSVSWYTRYGDWFAGLCLLVVVVGCGTSFRRTAVK